MDNPKAITKAKAKTISRERALDFYSLTPDDISSIQPIHNETNIMYNKKDIMDVVSNKYKLKPSKTSNHTPNHNPSHKIEERKSTLTARLIIHDLEYVPYGECYSYVYYGVPNIDDVIDKELECKHTINNKRLKFGSAVFRNNMHLDEKLNSYNEYIHRDADFENSIRKYHLEYFLKYNTPYEKFKRENPTLPNDSIISMSMMDYINNKNEPIPKNIEEELYSDILFIV